MYGMVNQAIKEMVVEKLGIELWEDVCSKASIGSEDFNSFEQYEDKVTLDLVVAICEATGKEAPEILESFGKYWISFAYKSEYKSILDTFSKSPVVLIKSLNSLHDRLEMSFDSLQPPAFDVVESETGRIIVNYYTERDLPLDSFVKGLFYGIFDHFNQKCHVEIIEKIDNASATFKITFDE